MSCHVIDFLSIETENSTWGFDTGVGGMSFLCVFSILMEDRWLQTTPNKVRHVATFPEQRKATMLTSPLEVSQRCHDRHWPLTEQDNL